MMNKVQHHQADNVMMLCCVPAVEKVRDEGLTSH